MNMFKIIMPVVSFAVLLLLSGCRTQNEVSGAWSTFNFSTSVVNTSPDGSVTVRVWGSGSNKASAIETAKKNALSDLIFKGVKGASGYQTQPIVTEVNARERYAEYFDRFFANGGEYLKFVKETSSSDKSRVRSKSDARENYGVTVTIDRPALVLQLRQDNVIVK